MADEVKREDLIARFNELQAQAADITAKAKSWQDQYDELRGQQGSIDELLKPVVANLNRIKEPLYGIQQEIAMISRALGGRVK